MELVVLMVGYWSVGLVGSDLLYVLRISWYMGLCSPTYCSEIRCLCWWYMTEYIVVHMLIGKFCWCVSIRSWCYWWGRIHVCCLGCAMHRLIGIHCVLYLMCSWYLCFKLWLVCTIYDIWLCITPKFIDAALVLFLSISGQFWFCELL
jgi:hypothetical protein